METEEESIDNHPFIIKTFGQLELSQHGFGYELFHAMKRHSGRVAQIIAETEEDQTYTELLRDCISVAINLKSDIETEDDVIGLCIRNRKETCVPYIAALFLGIKVMAFDTSIPVKDRADLFLQIKPRVMFVEDFALSNVEESLQLADCEDVKLIVIGENESQASHASFNDYLDADEEDIQNFEPVQLESNKKTSAIFFSSGTTGLPKGICLPSYGLLSQGILMTLSGLFGKSSCPIMMTFTELYWISAIIFLTSACISGMTRVVQTKFDPDLIWILIEKYKINSIFLSPFQCLDLSRSKKPEGIDTTSLYSLGTGGGSLSEKLVNNLRDILPGTFIVQIYGQTEVCGSLTMFQLRKIDEQLLLHYKPKSVGRPVPGFWFKVVDTMTGKIVGPNQFGELCVKSDYTMNGYFNKDCSEAFDEHGWLRTGDIVYFDEFQCFYVVDRLKELLKFRGWHIQPALLENILMTHPAVLKAVVIGLPDEEDGDHPMGVVILNEYFEDTTPEELELYVEERVDDRQRLRGGIKIVDQFPVTNSGKVKRGALKNAVLNGAI